MPKKPPRNNPRGLELRTVHSAGSGAAALLQRISRRAQVVLPAAAAGADGAQRPSGWLERLQEQLPPAQRAHLLEVIEKSGELVLFVDSAAWAGRIRLALPELSGVADGRRLTVRLKAVARERTR